MHPTGFGVSSMARSVIDGAFEPAFLANVEGNILHNNLSATRLLASANENKISAQFHFFSKKSSVDKLGNVGGCCSKSSLSSSSCCWTDIVKGLRVDFVQHWDGGFKRGDDNGALLPVDINLVKLEFFSSSCSSAQVGRYICVYVRDRSRVSPTEMTTTGDDTTTTSVVADNEGTTSHDSTTTVTDDNGTTTITTMPQEFGSSNKCNNVVEDEKKNDEENLITSYMMQHDLKPATVGSRDEMEATARDGETNSVELDMSETLHGEAERRDFINVNGKDEASQVQERSELIRRAAFDSSFDAMFGITEDGTILIANKAAVRQFGWSYDEFIGSNICMICSAGGPAQNHDAFLERFLDAKAMGSEKELIGTKRDGTKFPIELGLAEIQLNSERERLFCCFTRDLTSEKQVEAELKREHSLTMGIINASFDALFGINEKGIIQMVNDAAVMQFGWTRKEFTGQNISMICGDGHSLNHDTYIKRYMETGEKRVMGKKRELTARRKDGTEFPIDLGLTETESVSEEERLFCGFVKDLTSQKVHEAELKRIHNLTKNIVDASFDALFAINEDGTILMVNDSSSKQFGWTKEEFLGQNIKMVVGAEHADKHDGYIKQYLKTGVKKVIGKQRILEARRKDGSTFPIWLGLTEVFSQEGGGPYRFVAFVRDLTDQKKMFEMEAMYRRSQHLLQNMLPEEYYQYRP